MAKGPEAFRTISEAAGEVGVAQHVLRFWETKFPFIRPMRRAGGRRLYRPADIAMLVRVKGLLHGEGLTIRGVRQLHREGGLRDRAEPEAMGRARRASASHPLTADGRDRLRNALSRLMIAKAGLDDLLNPL